MDMRRAIRDTTLVTNIPIIVPGSCSKNSLVLKLKTPCRLNLLLRDRLICPKLILLVSPCKLTGTIITTLSKESFPRRIGLRRPWRVQAYISIQLPFIQELPFEISYDSDF